MIILFLQNQLTQLNQNFTSINKILESKNINELYLMFWNDKAKIYSESPIKTVELKRQAEPYGEQIEIIYIRDNKEMTIGEKRTKLNKMANGKYVVHWDDDDWIHPQGIDLIISGIPVGADCITYKEYLKINNIVESREYSIRYTSSHPADLNRPVGPKCVIKTSIAQQVKFKDIRYGEDGLWANDIKPLLKTEYHINEYIYYYD